MINVKYMKRYTTTYAGDVTVFTAVMVVTIMTIILINLAQVSLRQTYDNRISEGHYRAVQGANSGVEHWLYEFRSTGNRKDKITAEVDADGEITYTVIYDDENNVVRSVATVPIRHPEKDSLTRTVEINAP